MRSIVESDSRDPQKAGLQKKYIEVERMFIQYTYFIVQLLLLFFIIKYLVYFVSETFINDNLNKDGLFWLTLFLPMTLILLFLGFRLKAQLSKYRWWEVICCTIGLFLPLSYLFFVIDDADDPRALRQIHNFAEFDLLFFTFFIAILFSNLLTKIAYFAAIMAFITAKHNYEFWDRNAYFMIPHTVVTVIMLTIVVWLIQKRDRVKYNKILTSIQDEQLFRTIIEDLPECCLVITQNFHPLLFNKACLALKNTADLNSSRLTSADVDQVLLNMDNVKLRGSLGVHIQSVAKSTNLLMHMPNSEREIRDSEESYNPSNLKELSQIVFDNFQLIHDQKNPQETFFTIDSRKNDKLYEIKISLLLQNQKNCLLFIISDITEREKMRKVEENEKYKNLLLASFSHELRTPLNGSMSLVQKGIESIEIPNAVKEGLLQPALNSLKLLLSIINDFLDFSQFKANKLRLNYKETDFVKLVHEVKSLTEFQMKMKGLDFKVKLPDSLPSNFKTDETRVSQILVNLLSNAIKFTFKGKVEIILDYDSAKDLIYLTVRDTGIGIKEEEISKLIETLNNINALDEKINRNSAGIGLGLTISNILAKFLGQRPQDGLRVYSKYNEGSQFSLVLENKNVPYFSMRELKGGQESNINSKVIGSHSFTKNASGSLQMPSAFELPSPTSYNPGSNKSIKIHKYPPKKMSIFQRLDEENKMQRKESNVDELVENTDEYTGFTSGKVSETIDKYSHDKNASKLFPKDMQTIEFSEHQSSSFTPQTTILIVDDDSFNLYSLEVLLKTLKRKIDKAHNGREAVDKVLENPKMYTLIIMDCNMPILDGWEATKILKEKMGANELPLIPIVGCTAYVDEDNLNKCYEYGMDFVVIKPITTQKIGNILKEFNVI